MKKIIEEEKLVQYSNNIDLTLLLKYLWSNKYFIILIGLLSFIYSSYKLHNADYIYRVYLPVIPIDLNLTSENSNNSNFSSLFNFIGVKLKAQKAQNLSFIKNY